MLATSVTTRVHARGRRVYLPTCTADVYTDIYEYLLYRYRPPTPYLSTCLCVCVRTCASSRAWYMVCSPYLGKTGEGGPEDDEDQQFDSVSLI